MQSEVPNIQALISLAPIYIAEKPQRRLQLPLRHVEAGKAGGSSAKLEVFEAA